MQVIQTGQRHEVGLLLITRYPPTHFIRLQHRDYSSIKNMPHQQQSTAHWPHRDCLTRQTKRKFDTCARLSVIHGYRFTYTECLLSTHRGRQCESLTGLHSVHLSRPHSTYTARSTQKNMNAIYRMELSLFGFFRRVRKIVEKRLLASSRPSVRRNNSPPTGRIFMKFDI